jgi:hypothetical protein
MGQWIEPHSAGILQGRPWSVRARSVVKQLLLAGLALWAAATAVAALGAAWHALAGAGYSKHKPNATKYVLVIDSGSSGTRMYAYNWTLPAGHQQGAAGSILPVLQSIPPSTAAHLVPKKEKKGALQHMDVCECVRQCVLAGWLCAILHDSATQPCMAVGLQCSCQPHMQHLQPTTCIQKPIPAAVLLETGAPASREAWRTQSMPAA